MLLEAGTHLGVFETLSPRGMRWVLAAAAVASPTLAGSEGQGIQIDHATVGCIVVGAHPRFEVQLDPMAQVSRARIVFRPAGDAYWYSVEMEAEGEIFVGVLPKPTKELEGLDYYVDTLDEAATPTRTPDYSPIVVSGSEACQNQLVAATVVSATVAVNAPAGAAAIPSGFSSAGVAGAGGGLSTVAVVGGLAGAAAVGVVVAGGENGEDAQSAETRDGIWCGAASFDPAAEPLPFVRFMFEVRGASIDNFDFLIPINCGKGFATAGGPTTSSSISGDNLTFEGTGRRDPGQTGPVDTRVIIQGRFSSFSAASGSYQYFVDADLGFPACDGSGTWTAEKKPGAVGGADCF